MTHRRAQKQEDSITWNQHCLIISHSRTVVKMASLSDDDAVNHKVSYELSPVIHVVYEVILLLLAQENTPSS